MNIFVDSGAHSLYTKQVINKYKGVGNKYTYYDSQEFWDYVDKYAEWIKKYEPYLETYVSVDVIFSPYLSWKTYRYLKKEHGLNPLPVIHYGTDLKWIKRHLKECDYIGIGGVGQEVTTKQYTAWGDAVFNLICNTEDRMPICKTHGFAMTSHKLLIRYPWYSVDSTTWKMVAAMGSVLVPFFKCGKYRYDIPPLNIHLSNKGFFERYPKRAKRVIETYIEKKGYTKKELSESFEARAALNAEYYRVFQKKLPKWPWPFKSKQCGLFS